jgi:hypothetical protein
MPEQKATKKWYKSKEVGILGLLVVLVMAQLMGWDPQGITKEATTLYEQLSPVLALVTRLVSTSTKLEL